MLGHPHPAHLGQAGGLQIEGLGNGALGELDLQGQGLEQNSAGGLTNRPAAAQGQKQKQHQHNAGQALGQAAQSPAPRAGLGRPVALGGARCGQHGCIQAVPMIGWLQGQLADPWQLDKRCGLLLVCQGVGYEVQVSQRQWQHLPQLGSPLALHIHQAVRDDGWTLYGFGERHERDLFRELVGVSGVGPQMALGLLGCLETGELVQAIVQADLRRLCQAPGVGKRTAERLAVELRARLQQRFLGQLAADTTDAELALASANLPGAQRDEVQLTLTALGYEALEVHRALRAVASGAESAGNWQADDWIRECLRWLSRQEA